MITKRLIVIWIIISLIQPSLRFATTEPARAANVVYKSGHITHSEVWTADNLYVIQDNLTIDQGVSLTIQPGTVVKFVENKVIGVYGILRIGVYGGPVFSNLLPLVLNGGSSAEANLSRTGRRNTPTQASQDPVIITSIRDDTIGGDTNGDGNATAPDATNCQGITFEIP